MEKLYFKRLGPASGQAQVHKGSKRAPAKKGVWLLPMVADAGELFFLGCKNINTGQQRSKKDYKKFHLPSTTLVWSHFKPKAPHIHEYFERSDVWPWYKISINTYKKELQKYIVSCFPYSWDGEFAEIFYETT